MFILWTASGGLAGPLKPQNTGFLPSCMDSTLTLSPSVFWEWSPVMAEEEEPLGFHIPKYLREYTEGGHEEEEGRVDLSWDESQG